jgi:EAL domain-containing protein (putative c-di-GMP-specific phosphodiesterase class I)/response regulator RpfG family c-di-GMP phosphodiesterase/HPt (histidine-containing phosphotransfer) domain-containing protein
VLVAEDYGPNQTVLRLQLESLGCEVDMAGDGAAALVRWRQQRPSLILTDLNMPVMDGLALARAVRQVERETGGHTPIIAITAAAEQAELKRCRDAGMDDALTKPIALEGLRAVLARWAGGGGQTQPAADAGPTPAGEASPTVFDLTALYRVLGQVNPAQARELVDAFIESAGQGLAALARQPDDEQALAREMHKQKSSARTVGALHYARLAEALERSASMPGLDAPGRLAELAQALAAVRQATQRLEMPQAGAAPESPEVLPLVQCSSVLVVDDDVVVLKQMQPMLSSLGVAEVLTAANGMEAIATLSARATELEVVVCDLNMPEMDGVELIRRFGQTGFKGALILMSGAEPQILNTARQLAEMQGLRVLGLINKPVMPRDMAALLARAREQAPVMRGGGPARAAAQISVQEVREAMARDEFTVWFQPKVDTLSLQPTGLEALARWRRADGSFVPPDQFILLAEREGLIGELSHVLVARALREAARVHQAGFALKLAVNLSGLWLDDLNLPDIILTMAREAGIQPRDLVLEVTETGVMEDLTTALDVLTRLRLKGFGLSIDDFGIGYSSFEQLGRIPFTEMKLDRSFVNKGQQDPAARAILESSMGMAQKLGLVTVAEGVETVGELALVRELGCDNVQGYLVAKPMPLDALLTWLAQPTAAL